MKKILFRYFLTLDISTCIKGHINVLILSECRPGFFGLNCLQTCAENFYGILCESKCDCIETQICHMNVDANLFQVWRMTVQQQRMRRHHILQSHAQLQPLWYPQVNVLIIAKQFYFVLQMTYLIYLLFLSLTDFTYLLFL